MELTRRQAIQRCRDVWKDLAKTGAKDKEKLPGVRYDCWLCEYILQLYGFRMTKWYRSGLTCDRCPFDWPGVDPESNVNPCEQSLYRAWRLTDSKDFKARKNLAAQIAALPLKPRTVFDR